MVLFHFKHFIVNQNDCTSGEAYIHRILKQTCTGCSNYIINKIVQDQQLKKNP